MSSIAANLQLFELHRSPNTLDDYGAMSSAFEKVADLTVAVFKNQPTHDNRNPYYETTEYVGITGFVGVQLGDKIIALDGTQYLVKNLGDRGTQYQALYLDKQ